MVPRWKRLAYSLLSVLLGAGVIGLGVSCYDAQTSPQFDLKRILVSTCIVILASLPGWLVAIPVVVLVGNYNRWRGWVWGALGVCIGPGVILAFGLYGFLTDGHSAGSWSGTGGFLLLSTAVSTLSTSLYLFLVLNRESSQPG